jgi:hypothetical protein
MDELVMERAYQQEVVEIGAASVLPPPDVMRLGELTRSASRKSALEIPVPELPYHPG